MKTLKQIKEEAVYQRLKELDWHRGLTALSLKVHPSKVYQYINDLRGLGYNVPKSNKRLSRDLEKHLPKNKNEKQELPFSKSHSIS